jgi:hypothetical protein
VANRLILVYAAAVFQAVATTVHLEN